MSLFTAKLPSFFQRFLPLLNATYKARSILSATTVRSADSPRKQITEVLVFQYVVLVTLLAFPVLFYYYTINQNAYNFPYADDLNSTLSFISEYAFGRLPTWEKLKLIFSQYNEHRIAFDRLIFLIDYSLFGQVNFRLLILVGNLAPLLISLLFYTVSFRTVPLTQKLLYLVPVAYVLFSFQYWELSTWSMASLQNLYVIPFALFSLYSLCKPSRTAFALACVAAILATFTSGNGLFTFITGVGILVLLKSYRKLVLWLLIGSATVGLYFWGYTRPPYHPDITDSLLNHTGQAVRYFFTLLGSMVGAARPKLTLLFGLGSLLTTLGLVSYLWYQKRLVALLPLVGWLAFLYLTCLSLMASRSGMGIEQAYTPRYGIVVVMIFATQAVLALETLTQRFVRLGVFGTYALISFYFYFSATNQGNRHRIEDLNRHLRYNTALYTDNQANLSLHWSPQTIAKAIFNDAVSKGIFQVPRSTFSELQTQPYLSDPATLVDSHNVTSNVKPYASGNFLVIYRAWALLSGESPRDLTVQLVAKSETDCYSFDTQKHTWDDWVDYTLGQQYTRPGFSCVLNKKSLKPGHYTLWLCLKNGDQFAYQPLAITLDS